MKNFVCPDSCVTAEPDETETAVVLSKFHDLYQNDRQQLDETYVVCMLHEYHPEAATMLCVVCHTTNTYYDISIEVFRGLLDWGLTLAEAQENYWTSEKGNLTLLVQHELRQRRIATIL